MSRKTHVPGGVAVEMEEVTAVGEGGANADPDSPQDAAQDATEEFPGGDNSNSAAKVAVASRPRGKKRRASDQDLGSETANIGDCENERSEEIPGGEGRSHSSRHQRDSFDGVLSARKKKNRRKWASGHISAADAKVATLGPLPPCTVGDTRKKTKGCCFQCPRVTDDVDFQQRLRDLYTKTVREAPESGHAVGTGLLATMLRPHVRDPKEIIRKKLPHIPSATTTCMWCRRKESTAMSPRHKFSRETCPGWDNAMSFVRENQSERMLPRVPWIAPDGTRDGTYFEVHVETFKLLFNVSQGRLNHIRSLAKGGAVPSSKNAPVGDPEALPDLDKLDKRRKFSGGHNRLADDQVEGLLSVLRDAPCRTDPLTREYRFGSDLSLAWFWKRYLKSTGKDEAFLAQAERMNFYPTYDRSRRNKKLSDDQYAEDPEGKKLMPSVSYTAAIEVYARCKIKFDLSPGDDDPRRAGKKRPYSRRGGVLPADSDAGTPADKYPLPETFAPDLLRVHPTHPPGLTEPPLPHQRRVHPSTSSLQDYHPGMVKECVCSETGCPASSLPFVVINRGMSPPGSDFGFDWAKELVSRNLCPACDTPAQVLNVGFTSCRFRCEWKEISNDVLFETQWKAVKDVFYFNPDDDTEYQYMTIFVELE